MSRTIITSNELFLTHFCLCLDIALSVRGDGKCIATKALKSAIQCHLDEENVDYASLRYVKVRGGIS